MKIVALKEKAKNETRTAMTPEVAGLLVKKGYLVTVEKDIGLSAGFLDEEYTAAGAKISSVPLEIISDADIILKVQPSSVTDKYSKLEFAKAGAIIIGLLSPYLNHDYIKAAAKKNLTTFAMEFVPRITKAQNMDALSSQSNLVGYRAVIEASYHYTKAFPMMMTAAGAISPCKTLVLGIGVAGLQAIATAKRLGSIVAGYDVRAATKEQVESLGAKFVSPALQEDLQDKSGYASESSEDYKAKQEEFLAKIIKGYDIVITTAQIPGKKAPLLVTKKMLESMKHGSVIVDIATSTGGNVEGSEMDKIVTKHGVTIIGLSNLAAKIATDSSKLYAKNLYNFLSYALQDGKFNMDDDLVRDMLITKDGKIVNEKINVIPAL
ncbi:MAG: NAD(P) transhydrogenase subunit alpha [Rickettsia endosymbiont of Ixodes persulcatus]|nr:NAD(P) transhydrogenase subunit alpha [Rickettsia endosymbiont of Ixodes persulcatus]MCZ6902802.1 NAD(P) transhydrogenase subunit alpha [Rickettsia endosymbiont of Ixodes persulcatus]MCZ6908425.1 NAD(P) transhydrogenase subunit alpha [Rickettsia endosymbiont of Ixodes persulcatus]MCZ6910029.1 NAD(P) transhydrogenase subunit alpha [Rickettsia endosymbiont of Ixodes persulcatus]MCZ6913452.1 NAD(P) transhydrogenase subunit alpha [Rickettsia endosymbiont of Ixodes persulcatus]